MGRHGKPPPTTNVRLVMYGGIAALTALAASTPSRRECGRAYPPKPLSRPIVRVAHSLSETIGTKRPSSISITTVVTVSGSSGSFNEKAS